jgi:small GTP-binding protein
MNLSVGIVGMPNAGKSTLFNALLGRQIAAVAEYPFTTIEPNVGVVEVPDGRLQRLAEIIDEARSWKIEAGREPGRWKLDNSSLQHQDSSPASSIKHPTSVKVVPAAIKFIDIAGLVKDAHKGAGLGNQFLAKIRECHAILHVVRAFENPQVAHVMGDINPERDIQIINEELRQAGIVKPTFVYLNQNYPDESALDEVIKNCYKLLDLITMFTVAGQKQVQAWSVKRGTMVKEAVGMIHSDFADKFIRAEVIPFDKLAVAGSYSEAKAWGWVRVEGKEYEVKDGDVVTVKI